MEEIKLISEIGLTERESKVFLALLELGLTKTGVLVKKSGVPNSKIYEILESLQNKGLVSWIIKGKTKHFRASDPKKIISIYKEKEKEIEKLVSVLKTKQKNQGDSQFVELFEGAKSIFPLLNDLVEDAKKGEVYYSFSLGKEHEDERINIFYSRFGEKRGEKGLVVKIIANKNTKEIFEKVYPDKINFLKRIIRFTDFNFPQGIVVFRDSVIIIDWQESPTAIHIKSSKIASQYRNFFDDLWKIAKSEW